MSKRRRIIEGTWTCDSCGTSGIRGRHKVCPSCGSPREGEEARFDFGSRQASGAATGASVTDEAALAQARAGVDWHCAACGSANRGDAAQCVQCGATRDADALPPPSAEPAPAPEPALEPEPTGSGSGKLVFAGLGVGGMVLVGMLGMVLLCGLLWLTRPVEVEASVAERTFVREVVVQRLTPTRQRGWKDALPSPGSPPGSASLAPGRGEIHQCVVQACYPRPPQGGRLVRVTGRSWTRTVSTQPMEEHREEGWDEAIPRTSGRYPSNGSGGVEGLYGSPSCSPRERTPEQCRTEYREEVCGTEERCTVRDLGNGFAEEVCEDIPKTCREPHEVCDPAVVDDWCSWTELQWGREQSQTRSGRLDPPRWPTTPSGGRSRITRTQTNEIRCETLAGTGSGPFSVSEQSFLSFDIGQQYFLSGSRPQAVPSTLIRSGIGPFRDCGEGIPRGRLVDREECDYTMWDWVLEAPVTASGDPIPDWPAVDLRNDGVPQQREWAEIDMTWRRGSDDYHEQVTASVAEGEQWPAGRSVPVKVRINGEIDEHLGAWPAAMSP